MTLDELAVLLDRCADSGKHLSEQVASGDTEQIRIATKRLTNAALALNRAMPLVGALLAPCPPAVRVKWLELISAAAYPLKVGAEIASLGAARVTNQLSALAQASGANLGYASNGRLSL
jgi:hypothetical protein